MGTYTTTADEDIQKLITPEWTPISKIPNRHVIKIGDSIQIKRFNGQIATEVIEFMNLTTKARQQSGIYVEHVSISALRENRVVFNFERDWVYSENVIALKID